ncbi:uncharacterized protein PG998_002728 [Apiospora kogelbergensis]|uniref:uncharacterized protein n=1 Tax=Apiospora kogelbergensis TaxID=1337665 RepID=UPI00312D3A1D
MSSVIFTDNYIKSLVSAAVAYIDLGFEHAREIPYGPYKTPLTGKSTKIVVHYKDGKQAPRTFKASQEVAFPDSIGLTITGGGVSESTIEAIDETGNKGSWTLG